MRHGCDDRGTRARRATAGLPHRRRRPFVILDEDLPSDHVEPPLLSGGDDLSIDFGPGILFVGVDKGDQSFGVPTTTADAFVCVASDTLGLDILVGVDRGDVVPRVEFGSGCVLDVAGGGCELPSFQVVLGDADAHTVAVVRSGLPAGNGSTFVALPGGRLCLAAVGQACV